MWSLLHLWKISGEHNVFQLVIINANLDAKMNERLRRSVDIKLKHVKDEEKKPKKIETLQIFQQSMRFIQFFGNIFGCQISYEWKPNPAFFCVSFFLAFTWSQFIYSQFLHIQHFEHMKLLEVFAIYGIGLSVILN